MATSTEPLTGTAIDFFESVYADAGGDPSRVPWASRHASTALINWLNAVAPSLVRCGGRVAVAGCGLGADARELIRRGYDVTAFDSSPTAVSWARRLDPGHPHCYVVADLFDPPPRWRHRHELVVDVNNLQYLAPDEHADAIRAAGELVAPHGHLLVVCRGGPDGRQPAGGPPWPVSREALDRDAALAGLVAVGEPSCFTDDENVPRIRGLFRRG